MEWNGMVIICLQHSVFVDIDGQLQASKQASKQDPFQNFCTPLYYSGMAEDRIVKFCARLGPRSISPVMTNCLPSGRVQGHVMS